MVKPKLRIPSRPLAAARPAKAPARQSGIAPAPEREAATALFNSGRTVEAEAAFHGMLARNPRDVFALYHLALIQYVRKDFEGGLRILEGAMAVAPGFPPNWYGRAMLLQGLGRNEEALKSYDEALRLQPDYAEALLNSGALLREMLQHHAALERFERLLAMQPEHEAALANAATLLAQMDLPQRSIPMFERLVARNPSHPYALGMLAYDRLRSCVWTDIDTLGQDIVAGMAEGRMVCRPFAVMALPTTAEDQYRCARIFAAHRFPKAARSLWNGERYGHARLRIGYLSPDFREHPVSHLMSGIIERHDRSRFEIIAISVGSHDGSRFRARLEQAFDQFIDLAGAGALRVAQRIRELEIDILVDLAGYTSDGRPDVFAHRPAPIQATYLGYPGTLGTDYHDYIIADRHVIPPEHQAFYSEQVAYLPHTYLPTDNSVQAAEHTPTRAECGLPEKGPVLCAFSHNFKMHPAVFERWTAILRQLPGSVLWINSRSPAIQQRLRQAAQERGVDPSRLVFASRVPRVEDHLARYRLADVFLDTWPYNAHTTAADALMMGLPVVTYMGDSFPARVAGSLLHAIGLPELVTHSLDEYEAKVVALVREPEQLQAVKARLAANRATHPLFDTERFCRDLEAAFGAMRPRATAALPAAAAPTPELAAA
jgi:predicted O-linked N-acetylglucosamine transferase (SPINDLY family)